MNRNQVEDNPTLALARIRTLVNWYQDGTAGTNELWEMCELLGHLDDHLQDGGILPDQWCKASGRQPNKPAELSPEEQAELQELIKESRVRDEEVWEPYTGDGR